MPEIERVCNLTHNTYLTIPSGVGGGVYIDNVGFLYVGTCKNQILDMGGGAQNNF